MQWLKSPARTRSLKITSKADESGGILVTVMDSGVGIDPNDAARVLMRSIRRKPVAQAAAHHMPIARSEPRWSLVVVTGLIPSRSIQLFPASRATGPLIERE